MKTSILTELLFSLYMPIHLLTIADGETKHWATIWDIDINGRDQYLEGVDATNNRSSRSNYLVRIFFSTILCYDCYDDEEEYTNTTFSASFDSYTPSR